MSRRCYFVADPHVWNFRTFGGEKVSGINDRARACLTALKAAAISAAKDADTLVVLGDLFDGVRPEPQLLTVVGDVLRGGLENPPGTHLLVGNHDQCSTESGDHALGPLAAQSYVTVRERDQTEIVSQHTWCGFMPFRAGRASEWLPGAVAGLDFHLTERRLLALHMGIVDKDTPPWLRDSPNAVDVELLRYLMAQHDIRAVFSGDWHRRKVWEFEDGGKKRTIMQVGTLCPTGFDDAGLAGYGTLAWYDENSDIVGWEEIPGPRFVVARGMNEVRRLFGIVLESKMGTKQRYYAAALGRCPVYVRAVVPPEELAEARGYLAGQHCAGFEVLADQADAQVAARTAATLARSAETLDQALAEYVGAMELPEGVDRNEVLGAVHRYLSEAT